MDTWIAEWQNGKLDPTEEPTRREWIQSRPESIKKLMLQFPPSCLVKANRSLYCPAPGKIGIVTSLTEPDEENPDGQVSVRDGPDGDTRCQCKPEWLEVVGYWRGLTPGVVKKYIEEE